MRWCHFLNDKSDAMHEARSFTFDPHMAIQKVPDNLRLLLADDDEDDCIFFKEALEELGVVASVAMVGDGVELMQYLEENHHHLPHILYLDLNMPRKNGYECLAEIRENQILANLGVVIYSTSLDKKSAERLYEQGASYYIRKPAEFSSLKVAIGKSLELFSESGIGRPTRENFIITND
jgi:CheY-like chemotaxis protein